MQRTQRRNKIFFQPVFRCIPST